MKERPILFKGPMVKAILEGRKTQTRRIFKLHPDDDCFVTNEKGWPYRSEPDGSGLIDMCEIPYKCPYGKPGDRLWVRETYNDKKQFYPFCNLYKADKWLQIEDGKYIERFPNVVVNEYPFKWTPSIHMKRRDSRITLEIKNVRVERLQDITEADCLAEGVSCPEGSDWALSYGPGDEFKHLWETINGAESWSSNPWVWVVEFEVVP